MEILYHDIKTSSGQPADVVISALQKFIRRGQTEDAAWAAYELYFAGEELTEYLWKRLMVISVEDIGLGQPLAPVIIESLWNISRQMPRECSDYTLLFIHAVRYLCDCKKSGAPASSAALSSAGFWMENISNCRIMCLTCIPLKDRSAAERLNIFWKNPPLCFQQRNLGRRRMPGRLSWQKS